MSSWLQCWDCIILRTADCIHLSAVLTAHLSTILTLCLLEYYAGILSTWEMCWNCVHFSVVLELCPLEYFALIMSTWVLCWHYVHLCNASRLCPLEYCAGIVSIYWMMSIRVLWLDQPDYCAKFVSTWVQNVLCLGACLIEYCAGIASTGVLWWLYRPEYFSDIYPLEYYCGCTNLSTVMTVSA